MLNKYIDFSKYDMTLLAAVCVAVVFGAAMVFSTSVIMAELRWDNPFLFMRRQVVWVGLGFLAMCTTAFLIDYRLYRKYAPLIFLISIILGILVLTIGEVRGGARRWLAIGGFTVQPSEFAKLAMIIITARYIEKKAKIMDQFKTIVPCLVLFVLVAVPIALEPDLGTPLIIFMVLLALLFSAGMKLRVLLGVFAGAFFVGVLEILRKPYRIARVRDYFASFFSVEGASYQVQRSLYALGSGGLFGKGLGRSDMKLLYLPEAHTDFIFPIIGEELGFVGTMGVMAFFIYFMHKGLTISRRAPDKFGEILALGITLTIVFQAFFNMGVATGVLPAKGLPLPFISFGGTALVITMAATGILINISSKGKAK
ncbi:MAG: putative lipid II flippase FtsW [Elusimicrobia bacterium]|nr:putative lipid II flippase FtsW [Elusimicrobiota bacterium]